MQKHREEDHRSQSLSTTQYPPIKVPAAATSPSPAASAVRNPRSCSIASSTGFSPCKPSLHLGGSRWSRTRPRLCTPVAGAPDPVGALFPNCCSCSSRMPEQDHIPFLHNVLFPL